MDALTKQALNEAFKQLRHEDPVLRLEAIQKIAEIGVQHPSINSELNNLAQNDAMEDVREAASEALARFSLTAAAPAPAHVSAPAPQTFAVTPSPSVPLSSEVPAGRFSPEGEREIIQLLHRQANLLQEIATGMVKSTYEEKDKHLFRVHLSDVSLSINALASLMLKWIVASIPVAFLLWAIIFIVSSCTAGLF